MIDEELPNVYGLWNLAHERWYDVFGFAYG